MSVKMTKFATVEEIEIRLLNNTQKLFFINIILLCTITSVIQQFCIIFLSLTISNKLNCRMSQGNALPCDQIYNLYAFDNLPGKKFFIPAITVWRSRSS